MAASSDDVVSLLISLMSIDSTTGHEGPLADFLSDYLSRRGWTVHLQPLSEGSPRKNVFATRLPKDSVKAPRLVFNSHLDTVPPFLPPTRSDGKVFGRGSNDAKGQLAVMVCAAERLLEERPELNDDVALLFVVGEELDHIGMIKANELSNLSPDFLIVGEPTELKFARLQKGALKVTINVTGKAAHSGYPERGKSAVHVLIEILHEILHEPWPSLPEVGRTDVNVGLINGGQALNALAASASASLFFRVIDSIALIRRRLEEIVGHRALLDFGLGGNDPVHLSLPPFSAPSTAVAFNTDIPYFHGRPKAVFLFGAGSITNAHSEDEFVEETELQSALQSLVQLSCALLS